MILMQVDVHVSYQLLSWNHSNHCQHTDHLGNNRCILLFSYSASIVCDASLIVTLNIFVAMP